jgi:hypothetical protein
MVTATYTPGEPVVVPPGKVTLELTEEEAGVLISILSACVSNGPTSPIYWAIRDIEATNNRRFARRSVDWTGHSIKVGKA